MSPKGSHATYGGWEPRVCRGCDREVTLSGANAVGWMFTFNHATGAASSVCVPCLLGGAAR